MSLRLLLISWMVIIEGSTGPLEPAMDRTCSAVRVCGAVYPLKMTVKTGTS